MSAHANGEKSETAAVLTVKGDSWETKLDGKVIETGYYKLVDLGANPKQIDSIEDKDVPGRNDKTLNDFHARWRFTDHVFRCCCPAQRVLY